MKVSSLHKRAARRDRNKTGLDMNLVSLIDVFTILIFFLLFNVGPAEMLPNGGSVKLPESNAEQDARETVVVIVSKDDIVVDGRKVASVRDVIAMQGDLIEGLQQALALQSQRKTIRAENQARAQTVTIMGDKDIPYLLLRKVMITCAKTNYVDVAFALNRKASV